MVRLLGRLMYWAVLAIVAATWIAYFILRWLM